jgi:hypothetical protein
VITAINVLWASVEKQTLPSLEMANSEAAVYLELPWVSPESLSMNRKQKT